MYSKLQLNKYEPKLSLMAKSGDPLHEQRNKLHFLTRVDP